MLKVPWMQMIASKGIPPLPSSRRQSPLNKTLSLQAGSDLPRGRSQRLQCSRHTLALFSRTDKRVQFRVTQLCCATTLLFVSFNSHADIRGRVVRILDGDTLEVLQQNGELTRVRLNGIDAPEKAQPFGQRSR